MSRQKIPVIDRIMSKVVVNEFTGCWTVTSAAGTSDGYKQVASYDAKGKFKLAYAHRVSFEHFVRPLEAGEQIDHLCKNRACANPSHMEAVSQYENWRRSEAPSAQNSRKSTCKRGHSLDDAYVFADGHRQCLVCQRDYQRKYNAARRPKPLPIAPVTTA